MPTNEEDKSVRTSMDLHQGAEIIRRPVTAAMHVTETLQKINNAAQSLKDLFTYFIILYVIFGLIAHIAGAMKYFFNKIKPLENRILNLTWAIIGVAIFAAIVVALIIFPPAFAILLVVEIAHTLIKNVVDFFRNLTKLINPKKLIHDREEVLEALHKTDPDNVHLKLKLENEVQALRRYFFYKEFHDRNYHKAVHLQEKFLKDLQECNRKFNETKDPRLIVKRQQILISYKTFLQSPEANSLFIKPKYLEGYELIKNQRVKTEKKGMTALLTAVTLIGAVLLVAAAASPIGAILIAVAAVIGIVYTFIRPPTMLKHFGAWLKSKFTGEKLKATRGPHPQLLKNLEYRARKIEAIDKKLKKSVPKRADMFKSMELTLEHEHPATHTYSEAHVLGIFSSEILPEIEKEPKAAIEESEVIEETQIHPKPSKPESRQP